MIIRRELKSVETAFLLCSARNEMASRIMSHIINSIDKETFTFSREKLWEMVSSSSSDIRRNTYAKYLKEFIDEYEFFVKVEKGVYGISSDLDTEASQIVSKRLESFISTSGCKI